MALQVVPGYIGASGYNHPVELFRNLNGALTNDGKGLMGDPTGFSLTPSGGSMQLTVGPGYAMIAGLENASQGSYFAWNPAAEVIPWPAHSAQARWDTLVLRVIDTQYGVDSDPNGAQWEIVQGTPAGSPVKIADAEFLSGGDFYRPGAWWRVCDVLVESTDTNMAATTISDLRALVSPDAQRVAAGSLFLQRVLYAASGTFVKANYPNAKKINVKCVGGGGGSGGIGVTSGTTSAATGGGEGGAYAESWLDVSGLATSVTVTVGAAGAAGTNAPGNGGNGGSSSFGSSVVAPGGGGSLGGSAAATAFIAGGGSSTPSMTGDLQVAGEPGKFGIRFAGTTVTGQAYGGNGGNSVLGEGGSGSASLGSAGRGYGGGGGAGANPNSTAARVGAAGAPGIVIVDVYV